MKGGRFAAFAYHRASMVIKQAIKPENTGGIALCLNSPDPSALVLEDEIDSFVPTPLLWIVVP